MYGPTAVTKCCSDFPRVRYSCSHPLQLRHNWRLQGEVLSASAKDPEVWSAADKFTLVLEIAGLNATELSAYCKERGLFPEQE